jgi:phosphate uptake regulator
LSRRFYEQFGDEVTNELVNWFNAVDETYRNQLRELNELNWERFRSELRAVEASIRAEMDKRFSAVDLRFAAVDARLDGIDTRLDGIER